MGRRFQEDWGVTGGPGCGVGSGGLGTEARGLVWAPSTARGLGGTHRTPGPPRPRQDSGLTGGETETRRPNHRKDDSQNTNIGAGVWKPQNWAEGVSPSSTQGGFNYLGSICMF